MSLMTLDRDYAARVMRRLSGEIATPSHLREEARQLAELGLMKFVEWPSGFWKITDKGRDFLSEVDE
jgi:hypothetical protein